MNTYIIDFETYYDKQVSITTLGQHHYLHHPDCDIYLVGIYSKEADSSFVGEPVAVDWSRFHVQRLVAHNARFDRACFTRLQELGVIPADVQPHWECTADMVSALSAGRSLKAACEQLLGQYVSEETRNNLLGKSWAYVKMEGKAQEVAEYFLTDAWYCYHLWMNFNHLWSEKERQLSAHTRDMGDYGINIDAALLEQGRHTLQKVKDKAMEQIPWADGYKPVLSPKYLREECAKAVIPALSSLAEDSPECSAWEEQYGSSYPWGTVMRDFQKANTLLTKLDTLSSRVRPDGTFSHGLKYFGAHTGRCGGDAGFNIQNLPRVAMFGVDLRRMIIPRPKHLFVISDLGQIEQRILSWLAGGNDMMEQLETGISVYEAHARATIGYKGTEPLKHTAPDLYRLAKARVLELGYGAGASVFPALAKAMAGLTITPQQAQKIVRDFRASNPLVTALWTKLERAFSMHVGKDFTLPLPSGRSIYYRHVARTPKGLSAVVQGKRCEFFGGKLAENMTSATARDVLGEILLRLDAASYRIVMHVHDEVVVEVPKERAEAAVADIERIMTTPPTWLEGLFPDIIQRDRFMSEWAYAYRNAYVGTPRNGHTIFIAGVPGVGKNFLTECLYEPSLGGFADASEHLLGRTRFNSNLFHVGVRTCNDTVTKGDAKERSVFAKSLKKMAANQVHIVESKYRNASNIPWEGRVVVTLNTDPLSLQILPDVEMSNRNKVYLFKTLDKVLDDKDAARHAREELPALCSYLLNMEIPEHCRGYARWGVRNYLHDELYTEAAISSSTASLGEILTLFCKDMFAADGRLDSIERSATWFLQQRLQQDGIKEMLRGEVAARSIGKQMSALASVGAFPLDYKRLKVQRVWSISRSAFDDYCTYGTQEGGIDEVCPF